MTKVIDTRAFAEKYFNIQTPTGEIIPLVYNEVQNKYHDQLEEDYPEGKGIRENALKARREGVSTKVTADFTVDFIMSALSQMPLTNSDIYSHKDDETDAHFDRVNLFLNSFLLKRKGFSYLNISDRDHLPALRKQFLKVDSAGLLVSHNDTAIQTQTASAKVSGRGGTKQNILWSELAFYSMTKVLNAENLVVAAEQQVADGVGRIFRESTGNTTTDYMAKEWYAGKNGDSDFKSRFYSWFEMASYTKQAPEDWEVPEYYNKIIEDGSATTNQCYWHFIKTRKLKDRKRIREYPTYPVEAFLAGGMQYFDTDALLYYMNNTIKPKKTSQFAGGLLV